MKKLLKLALIVLVVLVVLSYLGFSFSDLFGDWMRKAGLTDEQIGTVDDVYGDAMDKVQQGVDYVGKELNVMTDRLAELISGSDEAYQVITRLYASTRLPENYENLDKKAAESQRLCAINGLLGGRNQQYQAGVNPYSDGESTWYAHGRFWEDNKIALGAMGEANTWPEGVDAWVGQIYSQNKPDADPSLYAVTDGYMAAGVFVSRGEEKIYPHSVAICDDGSGAGRALYIEDVKYENGVPATVYFSETDGDGKFSDGDGVLQAMSWEDFCASRSITAYIVPLNIFI